MIKTLIIFEINPEELQFYVMDLTEQQYEQYLKVDGVLLGECNNTKEQDDIIEEINIKVSEMEQADKLTRMYPINHHIEVIIHTGVLL